MWVLGIERGSLVLHSKLFHPLTYLPGSKIALLVPKGEIRRNKGISSLKQVFPSVLQIKLRALCTLAKCYTSKLQSRALRPFGAHCPVYRWVKAPPAIAARPVSLASRSVAKASSPGQPAFFLIGLIGSSVVSWSFQQDIPGPLKGRSPPTVGCRFLFGHVFQHSSWKIFSS